MRTPRFKPQDRAYISVDVITRPGFYTPDFIPVTIQRVKYVADEEKRTAYQIQRVDGVKSNYMVCGDVLRTQSEAVAERLRGKCGA